MKLQIAKISDINATLKLHYKYQIDSISQEDKKDGFVTTAFSTDELTALIEKENGLFIAKKNNQVVAYVMAASWSFWSKWPLFAHMIKDLENLTYHNQQLNSHNSYQYGPICIDKPLRGTGILEVLFEFAKTHMSKRFAVLVTFVNKNNPRSYQAHKRKLGLDVIQEFEFNNNSYYEMACMTKQ